MASNHILRIASKLAKNNLINQKWMRSTHHLSSLSLKQTLSIPETNQTELQNGIRVTTEDINSPVATVGVWIDTGVRYESNNTNGVTNFVEHMILKGTNNRSETQLESEIQNMGALLDSHSLKEETAFYIKCLSNDIPKAIEILGDLVSNPKMDENAIQSQREVILREMKESDTNYEEVVMNHLHATAFQQTPLAFSKSGPTENVNNLNRNDLVNYVKAHFKGTRIVLSAAGGLDHNQIVKLANEHLGQIKLVYDESEIPILNPCRFTGSDIRVRDDSMPLAHVAIALEGAGYQNPDHFVLTLASTLMGSWDRSHGGGSNCSAYMALASATDNLSHCFKSFNLCYKDTGLWGIYFVSERMKQEDFVWHLQEEWKKIATEMTDNQLNRAKNLLLTNILLQSEGSTNIAKDIGRQVLFYGRRIPLPEIESKIRSINAKKFKDVLSHYIWDRCPAVAAVGPVENLPLYEQLRGGMYWFRY